MFYTNNSDLGLQTSLLHVNFLLVLASMCDSYLCVMRFLSSTVWKLTHIYSYVMFSFFRVVCVLGSDVFPCKQSNWNRFTVQKKAVTCDNVDYFILYLFTPFSKDRRRIIITKNSSWDVCLRASRIFSSGWCICLEPFSLVSEGELSNKMRSFKL